MMDRYQFQTERQNNGVACSDCGSHSGHFSFCPVFEGREDKEITMAEVLDRVEPYTRGDNYVPKFDVADTHWLKAMGVLIEDNR